MENPAVWQLMEMVRKINEITHRARSGVSANEITQTPTSGAAGVDDYLEALASDPTTEWFTQLLREKNAELETERQRTERLAAALRLWRRAKETPASAHEADPQLLNVLRVMGIVES